MSNAFSLKCDLCGKCETAETGTGLTMIRFMMNLETKHACPECWDALRAVFKTGIEAVRDPLVKMQKLMERLGETEVSIKGFKAHVESAENRLQWKDRDFESVMEKLRKLRQEHDAMVGCRRDLFEGFENLKLLLDNARSAWDLGFWRTVLFFDSGKKKFDARADRIVDAMSSIRDTWSKDKPSGGGL